MFVAGSILISTWQNGLRGFLSILSMVLVYEHRYCSTINVKGLGFFSQLHDPFVLSERRRMQMNTFYYTFVLSAVIFFSAFGLKAAAFVITTAHGNSLTLTSRPTPERGRRDLG